MKRNYILHLLVVVFLFASYSSKAQNNLASNEYGSLIQEWLDKNKEKYNLSENDLSNLLVSDAYFSKKSRINHVYVNQAYQDVKIYNAISSVAVKENYVFYYDNGFIPNIASKINTVTPAINAQAAINSVVNEYNLGNVSNLTLVSQEGNNIVFSNGNVSKKDIPVTLVYQPTTDGSLHLAWDLSIHALNGENWYSVRVDAVTGEVLDTKDWILKCNFGDGNHAEHANHNVKAEENISLFKSTTSMMVDGSSYNVVPIPTESPNHGPRQIVTQPADIVASPFGWHDTNGVSGPEYTITRGNNVWAQDDLDGNDDDLGSTPEGTSTLTFDFPFNQAQQPIGYLEASLTNLFYMNNIMHDVWYQYGFDEVSGNFQQNNYGNGGSENDFVFADGQDGSGINNATFGTPPDGNSPGMTMFLWSAVGPPGQPLTINNGFLAGDYEAGIATFGAQLPNTPITSDVALVIDDNLGQPASTDDNDACNTITNGAALNGKIVILRRGVCEFGAKVLAAENEGAIAVIVVNNVADPEYINMAPGAVGDQVTIPSIMVSQASGDAIIAALENNQVVNATLVSAGPYQKDGSFDNGIVAHEYGHGISTRLAGGPSTSGCLNNAEQMGEGWSDWFALMLTMKATDLPETGRPIATYSVSEPVDGAGIRPFPYSTDLGINPLTYGDTNDSANISQPHGIGTVWATILWDLTWAYVNKYGFDPDFYNGTGGNNRIMQLVLDGLKLQGCTAGFVAGRDGILAADIALTGGADQCMIWETFAARGVGVNASQGTPGSRTDQVEDFTEPDPSDPNLQNCTSLSVDEFSVSNYSIYPNPANNVLNIKVKKNFGNVTMTITDINGRVVMTQKVNLIDDAQLNISALQSGMYILTIKGDNINTNDKILKN
ncbi:T9SS-dependent M36 family metallopeptidase [Lacinutrix chionoecetis]